MKLLILQIFIIPEEIILLVLTEVFFIYYLNEIAKEEKLVDLLMDLEL